MQCINTSRSIRDIWKDQGRINFMPEYQRNQGIWNDEKKALLIDSILNGFDIPKIYLHKQPEESQFEWAVVDGKQRLTTLMGFIKNEFPLSKSFVYSGVLLTSGASVPKRGNFFKDLSEEVQNQIWNFTLSLTEIHAEDSRDVNQMFIRLNDGVKLNDAEFRQGFGGQVIWMIGELEGHDFFVRKVNFKNSRFDFKEVACRLLFIEHTLSISNGLPNLNKTNLDSFTKNYSSIPDHEAEALLNKVGKNLSWISACFSDRSQELGKSSAQVIYTYLRNIRNEYADDRLQGKILQSLERFSKDRTVQAKMPVEAQDPLVAQFAWLSGQGTNDGSSILERAGILRKRLLKDFPEIAPKDKSRAFNADERYVLWLLSGKKCSNCSRELSSPSDSHADHVIPHSKGGHTSLENGQALCIECNLKKGNHV